MNHVEHQIQCAFVELARLKYPILEKGLIAIPNGGDREKKTVVRKGHLYTYCPEGKRLKDEGVVVGVWDLQNSLPRYLNNRIIYVGMIIETKDPKYQNWKSGGLTKEQIEYGEFMRKIGWYKFVMYDVLKGMRELDWYMEGV